MAPKSGNSREIPVQGNPRCQCIGVTYRAGSTIKDLIIIHPKNRLIFFSCRVYDAFLGVRFMFFSQLCRVYDYLIGVGFLWPFLVVAGCTILSRLFDLWIFLI